jgi:hypothetical protein
MTQPLPGGLVAGPTFELYEFKQPPAVEIQALVTGVEDQHPAVGSLLGSLSVV